MRGNAADRAAVPPREEKLRLAMFEPRILARREESVNLALQRRHPRRIAAIEAIGELDEFAQIGLVLDRVDRDRAVGMSAHGGFPEKVGRGAWRERVVLDGEIAGVAGV